MRSALAHRARDPRARRAPRKPLSLSLRLPVCGGPVRGPARLSASPARRSPRRCRLRPRPAAASTFSIGCISASSLSNASCALVAQRCDFSARATMHASLSEACALTWSTTRALLRHVRDRCFVMFSLSRAGQWLPGRRVVARTMMKARAQARQAAHPASPRRSRHARCLRSATRAKRIPPLSVSFAKTQMPVASANKIFASGRRRPTNTKSVPLCGSYATRSRAPFRSGAQP
jgi:hypothetical protein